MEDQVIILAQLAQLKELQSHLAKVEKNLKDELARLEQLEDERKWVSNEI